MCAKKADYWREPTEQQLKRFASKAERSDPKSCWLWHGIMRKDGYGAFSWFDHTYLAHRLALIWRDKKDPTGVYACHRCGNKRCVNPDHLYWGSQIENMADCKLHGTDRRGRQIKSAKLTELSVTYIWNAYYAREASYDTLMSQFAVSRSTIDGIILKQNWRHITEKLKQPPVFPMPRFDAKGTRHGMSVLDPDKVRYLRKQHAAGAQISALARKLSVGESTVRNVVQRKTWQHVED